MHRLYLFQSNPDLHFPLLPIPSAHLSVRPMPLWLPCTVHPFHLFSPAHRWHQSMQLLHLPLPDQHLSLLLQFPPPFRMSPHCCQNIRSLPEHLPWKLPARLLLLFSSSCSSFLFLVHFRQKDITAVLMRA